MPDGWQDQGIKYDEEFRNTDIAITLDQHLYPALLPLIQKYAQDQNLKIIVNEGTCGISSGMLARKAVDIGGFCCAPGKIDRLPGLKFHTVGIEAIAILVHPDNPVDNISIGQAREIFMGDILRWSEIIHTRDSDRMDIPVQPVGRLHCKLRPGHWRLLLDNEDLFDANLKEVGAIPDMISQVALNPGAIGYEVLWNTVRYRDKGMVKAINIDHASPQDALALVAGQYPLYRVYNLTSWDGEGINNPAADRLIEYIISQGKFLEKEHNIIPASRLRNSGWKFSGDELVGEPYRASK